MSTTLDGATALASTSPLVGAVENKLMLRLGGNVHLVGTPEQIVEWFVRLHDAGCDGMQVNLFDCLPDLWRFGEQVVPLMVQAGLRKGAE